MNTKRKELHQLIDTLPENEIEVAKGSRKNNFRFLRS